MIQVGLRLVRTSWKGLNSVFQAKKKWETRLLRRFGAFVRQGARRSIRKSKLISPVGLAPYPHTNTVKANIYFVVDPNHRSVVIGPILFPNVRRVTNAMSSLEYGGIETWFHLGRMRIFRYRPRPFMTPAFERELPKLPQMWKDTM